MLSELADLVVKTTTELRYEKSYTVALKKSFSLADVQSDVFSLYHMHVAAFFIDNSFIDDVL